MHCWKGGSFEALCLWGVFLFRKIGRKKLQEGKGKVCSNHSWKGNMGLSILKKFASRQKKGTGEGQEKRTEVSCSLVIRRKGHTKGGVGEVIRRIRRAA